MGTVGGKTCWELLVMLTFVLTVGLASLAAGQLPDHLKALCPAYPNCDNALLAEYDRIYKASLIQAPAGAPQAPVRTTHFVMSIMLLLHKVSHVPISQTVMSIMWPLLSEEKDKHLLLFPCPLETSPDLCLD